jgi:hypothetical protein
MSRQRLSDVMVCAVMDAHLTESGVPDAEAILATTEFQALRRFLGKRQHMVQFHAELPAVIRDWATEPDRI